MKLNMNGSWIIDRKQTSQDVIPLEWCVVHNKSNKDKKGNFLMVYAKFTDFVKDNFGGI